MTLDSAIERFLQFLTVERNLAPSTIEAYRYDLERFRNYLQQEGQTRRFHHLEAYDLKDYLAHLREDRNCKPTTLSRVVSSLRMLFRWGRDTEILESNPAAGLHQPKKGKKLPVYLIENDLQEVLKFDPTPEEWTSRDRAILVLLAMTGIRLAEIVGLDLESLDQEQGVIRVFGKGRKERLVPLNETANSAIAHWMKDRSPAAREEPALFLSKNGDRISRRTVQHLVKKTAKALGLDPRLSPHKLRHTFATLLLSKNTDLLDIQELLGHKNIVSTSVYTHTNVDRVKAAVGKLNLD